MDVEEQTHFALEILYDRFVPGGLSISGNCNSVTGGIIFVGDFPRKYTLGLERLDFLMFSP
tara:strand:+ start:658 stop:840 length:183 start_codon:yes stop_codon:yes gene_type:complete